jgi:TrmH family RNA methyltransferase
VRLLTLARDLKRRRAREERHLFVAEGIRTVDELLRSSLRVRGALATGQLLEDVRGASVVAALRDRAIPVQQVTDTEFESAADTEAPQGILALAEVPIRSFTLLPIPPTMRLIVLDAVQDPGNVGTIVRTAAALGALATVALPGTVDLWNAKVVRSAMGAHFHHPAFSSTWIDVRSFLDECGVSLWGADGKGEPLDVMLRGERKSVPSRLALAVGNEGSGLSSELRERADRMVALPIAAGVESLNVAVATGIFLYELRP